jgi:toxin ParE1/3/4
VTEICWTPILTAKAQNDLRQIVEWTTARFGEAQSSAYRDTILSAIKELRSGPDLPGARDRDALIVGLRMIHVGRHGKRGRHFILFRVRPDESGIIDVLRILHDSMDLQRHLSFQEEPRDFD